MHLNHIAIEYRRKLISVGRINGRRNRIARHRPPSIQTQWQSETAQRARLLFDREKERWEKEKRRRATRAQLGNGGTGTPCRRIARPMRRLNWAFVSPRRRTSPYVCARRGSSLGGGSFAGSSKSMSPISAAAAAGAAGMTGCWAAATSARAESAKLSIQSAMI